MTELNSYISNYTGFNSWLIKKRYEHLSQYFRGKTCLELGVGDGSGTGFLVDKFKYVTVVDGSEDAIHNISEKYPETNRFITNFEDLSFPKFVQFQTIILAHVLEHVDSPKDLLEKAYSFLAPGGVLIVDVPNGDSIHRQLGVELGLLNKRYDLNETDISIGHKRVYSYEEFIMQILSLPIKPAQVKFGGMFLKVLSETQSEKVFTEEQLDAFFEIGAANPEIAAEIYAIIKES